MRLAGQHILAIYEPSSDVTWNEADSTYLLEAARRGWQALALTTRGICGPE